MADGNLMSAPITFKPPRARPVLRDRLAYAVDQLARHPYGCGCADCVDADEVLERAADLLGPGLFELLTDEELDALAGEGGAQ